MQPIRTLSVSEQAAEHLRKGLYEGRWGGTLPGVVQLAAEMDVAVRSMRAALRQIEAEGLIRGRGAGRSREVALPGNSKSPLRTLHIGVLPHDISISHEEKTEQVLLRVKYKLESVGHTVFSTKRSQAELQHDPERIIRHIKKTPADAWIVISGSAALLEWFASQAVPVMALYGRTDGLRIARTGPDKVPPFVSATRELIALGHRRIVLITARARIKPVPGNVEQAFLDELSAHEIAASSYNLPEWEETPAGLRSLLDVLYKLTPPTALIVEETPRAIAVLGFLAERGIKVPGEVSLISADYDNSLAWFQPPLAHMQWDDNPIIRRIVRWCDAVCRGKPDHQTINFPAVFVRGGSVGPVALARDAASRRPVDWKPPGQ